MADVVATPVLAVPAPVEGVQVPVIDRMKAELLALEADDTPAAEPEAVAVEDASDEAESPSEETATEDDKKPNAYQRLKAKAEADVQAVQAQVATSKREAFDALAIANQWRAEALAQKERFERFVLENNIQLDPREQELFTARRQLSARDLADKVGQLSQAEQKKLADQQAHEAGTAKLKASYVEQTQAVMKQYPGLNGRDLLLGYAGLVEAAHESGGKIPTLQQVAKNMAAASGISARSQAEKEQLRVNAGAPQTVKATRNVPLRLGNEVSDMKALLVSQGLV